MRSPVHAAADEELRRVKCVKCVSVKSASVHAAADEELRRVKCVSVKSARELLQLVVILHTN